MALLPKPPPQVVRILLLAAAIVGTYLVARAYMTPASFKQYGFYRGEALGELASHEPVYAGRKACEECHEDQVKKVAAGAHKTLGCEGCHGPGAAHASNPDLKLEVLTYSHCVRCHESNPSRPKWHKQIIPKDHYTGSKCTECHIPHHPTETP